MCGGGGGGGLRHSAQLVVKAKCHSFSWDDGDPLPTPWKAFGTPESFLKRLRSPIEM